MQATQTLPHVALYLRVLTDKQETEMAEAQRAGFDQANEGDIHRGDAMSSASISYVSPVADLLTAFQLFQPGRFVARFIAGEVVKATQTPAEWLKNIFDREFGGQATIRERGVRNRWFVAKQNKGQGSSTGEVMGSSQATYSESEVRRWPQSVSGCLSGA